MKITLSEQLKTERIKLFKYQVQKTKSIKEHSTVFDNNDSLYSIAYTHKCNYTGDIQLDIDKVFYHVGMYYKVDIDDVLGTSRKLQVIKARHVIAFILYQFLPLTLESVGLAIGKRDHSTIRHAVFKIADMIKYYMHFRKDILTILTRLKFIKDK